MRTHAPYTMSPQLLSVASADALQAGFLSYHCEESPDEDGVAAAKAVMRHPFFAVCPLSNIFIHNALPPIGLMRKSGIPICVGTDSLSSNDTLDMVRELYCLQENYPALSLGEMLGWACRNGAAMLGKEAVYGSLAPGKRPGLVFIDHLTPDGRLTSASVSRRIL